MNKQIEQVIIFNKLFRAGFKEKPCLIDVRQANLRFSLMEEENKEYFDAFMSANLLEIADSLGDQLYVLLGTIINHGMQDIILPVFDAIHENNMSKTDENGLPIINGENGVLDTSRPMGKVLKPKNFKPVDLTEIVYGK